MTGLRTNVADLLHHPGSRRTLHLEQPVSGLQTSGAGVPDTEPLVLDVALERVSEGIVARGQASGQWSAQCSRCLVPIERPFTVTFSELFEETPIDDETYPLQDETIDLELPVRDAILLDLPLLPLCKEDCVGLCPICGTDRNLETCDCVVDESDSRWSALKDLNL